MHDALRVAIAVSLMNVGGLWARREASAVVVFGMAAVAFLFVALFAMSAGLQAAIAAAIRRASSLSMLPGTPSAPGSFRPMIKSVPVSLRMAATRSLVKRVLPARSPPYSSSR